jgi:hypothetical protein
VPRTIVYRTPRTNVITRDALGNAVETGGTGDGYTERLSKYIPAEVLAAFIPLVGLGTDRSLLLLIAFVIGLAATVMYLYIHARGEADPIKRPRWFFYLFAGAAFVAWAIGTSDPIRALFGWDTVTARFTLAIAAFAIPILDLFIDSAFPRKASP